MPTPGAEHSDLSEVRTASGVLTGRLNIMEDFVVSPRDGAAGHAQLAGGSRGAVGGRVAESPRHAGGSAVGDEGANGVAEDVSAVCAGLGVGACAAGEGEPLWGDVGTPVGTPGADGVASSRHSSVPPAE